jgi:hypothetical protein
LDRAWEQVRRNRGAAGIDDITLADVERYGIARLLGELATDLKERRYRPLRPGGCSPDLDDGIVLCAAPLAGLFPAWPDAAGERAKLRKGAYPWATVARWREAL